MGKASSTFPSLSKRTGEVAIALFPFPYVYEIQRDTDRDRERQRTESMERNSTERDNGKRAL